MLHTNRNEKLKTLQAVFQGNKQALLELHNQRRQKEMPFLSVHGFVQIRACSPLLLDLLVMSTESLINGNRKEVIPLRECLRRFDEVNPDLPYHSYSAIGAIDGNDSQFDCTPLNYIQIQHRNYSNTYLKGKTIADLRHYFSQSVSSLNTYPFLLLSLESDLSCFEWYFKKGQNI